jgi:FAD/FMN-containing dehydrogenase
MNAVLRIDDRDHVAVVQPGITLRELDDALAACGLRYPVYPGEMSASLGGNVNTNAGGMRAVRHGVTRQHVLGLELVLMDGTVLRTGGSVVKSSSGYDLTQLVVGSEGTLAMVTEITLRLSPRLDHGATILVPFATLDQVTNVVSPIQFLADATAIAQRYGVFFAGCGHVGDGNVHLSVLENDEAKRQQFLDELFAHGVGLGGAISGEHGIGIDKKAAFLALSDPVSLALQRSIKSVFDPQGLLNPYRLLDERELP